MNLLMAILITLSEALAQLGEGVVTGQILMIAYVMVMPSEAFQGTDRSPAQWSGKWETDVVAPLQKSANPGSRACEIRPQGGRGEGGRGEDVAAVLALFQARADSPRDSRAAKAVRMDLKEDRSGKLSGSISMFAGFYGSDDSWSVIFQSPPRLDQTKCLRIVEAKLQAEHQSTSDREFIFTTRQKIENHEFTLTWRGKVADDDTLQVSRVLPSGAIDPTATLVFQRKR